VSHRGDTGVCGCVFRGEGAVCEGFQGSGGEGSGGTGVQEGVEGVAAGLQEGSKA
jgi:hypothetical protein